MTEFAMMFPGQGSQSVGMLADLAETRPEVRETFREAGEALGLDLWQLARRGPADELNRTELTQPAMLAGGIAVWRAWRALGGPMPAVMAGHSLGEYSALVAAEAIDFADAIRIVSRRGQLMQSAVPAGEGAMAAILGLDDEVVEAICREAQEGQVVAPANYNSPGQLVIAGDAAAVERAMHKCRDAGAKRAMVLPVSVPSHCALMDPAGRSLVDVLAETDIRSPKVPILHNVDVAEHAEPGAIREALVRQLSAPVRWTATVQALAGRGIGQMAECGPGRVLSGLGRRIDRAVTWVALEQPGLIEQTIEQLKE
jgi:[acyl-carrier-protein] S-malonyltransferase